MKLSAVLITQDAGAHLEGLLDGPHGLLLCRLMGGATFLKSVKLWLLWRDERPAGEMDP